jgi:hypothetical protein
MSCLKAAVDFVKLRCSISGCSIWLQAVSEDGQFLVRLLSVLT